MEKITLEDLQEQHRQYAEIIGVDNLIRLAKAYGGTQIYIPKADELMKNRKYQAITEDYDRGAGIKELARKYGVSESTVYRLVREKIIRGRGHQIPGQVTVEQWLTESSKEI